MDRRQIKTRIAIFEAFERLLAQHSYSRITVQQIIDEANVGRTTFYAHFETKDALLQELCAHLFDHVFTTRGELETSHDFSLSEGDARTIVTHILYHLQDNGKSMARLLTGENSEAFVQCFKQHLSRLVSDNLGQEMDGSSCPVPRDFLLNHLTGSFVNMVQWWLARGMKEPPERLAEWYLAVVGPVL